MAQRPPVVAANYKRAAPGNVMIAAVWAIGGDRRIGGSAGSQMNST